MTADGDELDVETATGDHYHARAALVATGSSYRRTDAEGEDDLIGAGVHFCATCDGPFYKGSDELMVIGGGNSGLEEGVFLTQFTDKVTIVERGDRLRGSRILQDKVLDHPRMEVELRHGVKEFRKKEDGSGKLGTVVIEDLESGEIEEHHPAGVFVFIGLDPNTDFLEGVVDLDERGFVADRPDVHELDAGRLRRRRRAGRVDEAARVGGGRGRGGGDPDPRLSRPARAAPDGVGEDAGMDEVNDRRGSPMDPKEIFELIVKADEKLKYATAEKSDARRRQATDLLTQALDAARQIGNDALVQQAELRLVRPGLARLPVAERRQQHGLLLSGDLLLGERPGHPDRHLHLSQVGRAPVARGEVGLEPSTLPAGTGCPRGSR